MIPPRALPEESLFEALGVDEASLVVPASRPDGSLSGSVQVRVGPLTCSHPGGAGAYPDVHRVPLVLVGSRWVRADGPSYRRPPGARL